MIFFLLIILTLLLSLIAQVFAMSWISVAGAAPQVLMASVLYFSLRYGAAFGEVYGFFCGLLADLFTASVFGTNCFVFTVCGYAAGTYCKKLDERRLEVQVILVLLASLFQAGTGLLLGALLTARGAAGPATLAAGALYTTVLSPVLFAAYSYWTGKVEKWAGKVSRI